MPECQLARVYPLENGSINDAGANAKTTCIEKRRSKTQQEKRPAHVGRAIPVKQSHRRKDFKR